MIKGIGLVILLSFLSLNGYADEITNREDLLSAREDRLAELMDLMMSLEERHYKNRWPIGEDQQPNPNYSDGFENTRERFIDNKDRHDLEQAYLDRALTENFYFSSSYIDYLDQLKKLEIQELRQRRRSEKWSRFRHCNQGRLRLGAQSTLDAIPLVSAIQAELLDKLKDRNSHSPASGFSGILGGILGSFFETARHSERLDGSYVDQLLEFTQKGVEEEFDGGLWAVTRIVWSDSFGVNSPCFIARRKIEALDVEINSRD